MRAHLLRDTLALAEIDRHLESFTHSSPANMRAGITILLATAVQIGGTLSNAREYLRDENGRFAPAPYSEEQKANVLSDFKRSQGNVMAYGDEDYAAEREARTAPAWRKAMPLAERSHAERKAAGLVGESDERAHRGEMLHWARVRDRETLALARLEQSTQARQRIVGNARQIGARVGRNGPIASDLAAEHYARRAPKIAAMHEAIAEVLDQVKRETLRKLKRTPLKASAAPISNASGVAADVMFDLDKFRDRLLARIRSESADTLQAAGEELFTELGQVDPFSMPSPKAREFLDARANKLVDIPQEIYDDIKGTIDEGLQARKSTAQIARDIREKFAQIEEGRAATIASTEIGSSYGAARQEGLEQAGITHKRWLTSHLPTVRDTHRDAEDDARNQRVPVGEPFHVGADLLMFPGDPTGSPGETINCHCIVGPADEEATA